MWSDRPTAARRARLADRLRALLPPPRPAARGAKTPLAGAAAVEPVAEELRQEPGFAWLDGAGWGGARLYARPLAVLSARNGRATVDGPGGRAAFAARGLDLLDAALAAWGGAGGELVGFLGYELTWELEELPPPPPDDLGLPDLHLALYPTALRRDARGWTLDSTDAWPAAGGDARIAAERLLQRLARRAAEAPPEGPLVRPPLHSRPLPSGFADAVARSVGRIAAGEIFQVNLCRRLETRLARRAVWPLWQRLRAASPADYAAFLDLSTPRRARALLSVSPECFLAVRDGVVESRPIKGTRPRGADRRSDAALARELLESGKDRAELAMIVDVVRNDLGRVAVTGSVEVAAHAELMTLPTLHHTVSRVRARLAPGTNAADLLRASFPPASISGAPKIRAVAVAAAEEERRRGPAMGAVGRIALSGELDLSVAIRTAVAARERVAYHTGGGIVADSDPEAELEETRVKARAFLAALGLPEAGAW
ncbi:MAG TPA: anthranilate synthase component I family protein [Thermoanaerobaculia bacterium]|nr:anthranilate synthase component I family protein [Thermoanaerobaculia bacterium]